MHRYMPILNWMSRYDRSDLKGDLLAGLTVGVMLVPQGMAYAMIAGLPPVYGLYAATFPLIIYAFLGTSRQLAVGPVAIVSLLTAASIGELATEGAARYIELTILLGFLVGVCRILLGIFKIGFLVNFMSQPVIRGYTYAAALIIGLSQLKHLLGVDIPSSTQIHQIISYATTHLSEINWPTFIIGLSGAVILIGVKKISPRIPGPLFVVLMSIALVSGLQLESEGVKIVGMVPHGLPTVSIPQLRLDDIVALLPAVLVITLISFVESISIAKTIQAKHKNYKVRPNQELIALGAANLGGAFFQSYPITGGFSRTAVNDEAGARTGLAGIFSASLILLTLLFLTPLFYHLPKAILASVIMVAVFGLIKLKKVSELWENSKLEFSMMILTFGLTLILGIAQGIGAGVVLSLIMIIYQSSKPHIAVLGRIPGTGIYRNVQRFTEVLVQDDILIIRLDGTLYFANVNYFVERVEEMIEMREGDVTHLIINAESISYLDSSAADKLIDFIKEQQQAGREVYFSGVVGPVRDAMKIFGLFDLLGRGHFFLTVQQAVDYATDNLSHSEISKKEDYVSQVVFSR